MRAGIHLARVGLAVALLAGLAAGCGGDDDSGDLDLGGGTPTPTATTGPGATPASNGPGEVVVEGQAPSDQAQREQWDAWVRYMTAFADAAATRKPDLEPLRQATSSNLFAQLQEQFGGGEEQNAQKGRLVLHPEFRDVDGEERLVDCVDLSDVKEYDASGNVVGEDFPDARLYVPRFGVTDRGTVIDGFYDASESLCA